MSCSLPSCCCSTWSFFDWLHIPFQLESVVVAVAAAPTVNAESFIWNADMDEAIGHFFSKRPSSLSVSRMFICNPLTSSLLTTAWIKTLNVVYDILQGTRDYSAHDPHVELKSSLGVKFSPLTCTWISYDKTKPQHGDSELLELKDHYFSVFTTHESFRVIWFASSREPTEFASRKCGMMDPNSLAKEFICPICNMLLFDPVIAEDGFVYDKECIGKFIAIGRSPIRATSESLSLNLN